MLITNLCLKGNFKILVHTMATISLTPLKEISLSEKKVSSMLDKENFKVNQTTQLLILQNSLLLGLRLLNMLKISLFQKEILKVAQLMEALIKDSKLREVNSIDLKDNWSWVDNSKVPLTMLKIIPIKVRLPKWKNLFPQIIKFYLRDSLLIILHIQTLTFKTQYKKTFNIDQ